MTTTSVPSPDGTADTTGPAEGIETAEPAETAELTGSTGSAEPPTVTLPEQTEQTGEPAEQRTDPSAWPFAEPSAEPLPEPLGAAQPGSTGPGGPTARPAAPAQPAPAARVVGGVWSASSLPEPEAPRAVRPWTLTWGVLLVSIGLITLFIGLGARINLATAGISVLGALGVLLLVLALLPQRGSDRSGA